ncbi:MAG: hypothetical protein PUC69_01630 [Ruminococcus sp.]|nr:hypothetical protein [Ruminococcus sp.]MDD5889302.1 hypothetical protein [Ruminococcus sp.]
MNKFDQAHFQIIVPAITASAKTVNHQVVSASDDDSSFDEDDSGDFAYSKIVTLNNPKSVKYTVKNLSSKKKYYVRTRTYKKIGKIQYSSDWSKSKTVTVK